MRNISLQNHYLTDQEKQEICSWKYEKEFAVYNLPSYEVLKEKQIAFLDSKRAKDYRAFYHNNVFVGYANIREKEKGIFIGIGVKPDLCSRGYGQLIMKEVCGICKELYPEKQPYLEVRTWNERAICCYRKSGFEIVGEAYALDLPGGIEQFYRMEKVENKEQKL